MPIETLSQFYEVMRQTQPVRQALVSQTLYNHPLDPQSLDALRHALQQLTSIPEIDGQRCLRFGDHKTIRLDLSYEVNELKKDLFFLTHSEDEFLGYLDTLHTNFSQDVQSLARQLCNITFNNFITDRDGTVNNYCGRYTSSVQSVYNAVFLTRFARKCTKNAVILTSAPLDNIGLVDISVSPSDVFIYAGSKGREYINQKGGRNQFPIEKTQQEKLNSLNHRLSELTRQPAYEMFSLIGSGLQFKFGQTTIARQDINQSIPIPESQAFLETIQTIVQTIDPEGLFFRIEDTGKDIEIILTVESTDPSENVKDFDKGDGVLFLHQALDLQLDKGPALICGDTASDVPMVTAAMDQHADTRAIFVTRDKALKQNVANMCPQSLFVSEPDVLVTALNISQREKESL